RAVGLPVLEQDSAQIQMTLHMRGIERERPHERAFGLRAIAGLPRRQAGHVEAPAGVRAAPGVGLEERRRVIVPPLAVRVIREPELLRRPGDMPRVALQRLNYDLALGFLLLFLKRAWFR